jgi:hypothetical protein
MCGWTDVLLFLSSCRKSQSRQFLRTSSLAVAQLGAALLAVLCYAAITEELKLGETNDSFQKEIHSATQQGWR